MAGAITLGEKGLTVTKKDGNRKTSTTVGNDISFQFGTDNFGITIKSDGTIGGKISSGGFTVGADSSGGFTAKTPVGGISYNSDGSGEITAPFGIAKVEVERKDCTYILRTYIAGALTDTEYREIPDCKEPPPPPKEDPPKEDPPPPKINFEPLDPGKYPFQEDAMGIAFVSWRQKGWHEGDGSSYITTLDVTGIPQQPYRKHNSHFYYGKIEINTPTGIMYDHSLYRYFSVTFAENRRSTATAPHGSNSSYTNTWTEGPGIYGSWIASYLNMFAMQPHYIMDWRGTDAWNDVEIKTLSEESVLWTPQYSISTILFGSWSAIKRYISRMQYYYSYSGGGGLSRNHAVECTNIEFYSDRPKSGPYTGGGTQGMSNCCKEQKVDLARLEEALERLETVIGTKAILDDKDGYAVPNKMLIPGGDGYTYSKNYLGIFTSLFASIDRYGFDGPIVVDIPDVAKDKSGDQGIRIQVNSLSTAIQTLLSLAIENKGDASTRLNIQVRLAFMQTRMMRMTHKIYYLIVSILEGLGIPTIKKIIKGIPFEFNLNPEELGFGKKAEELDTMDENSLEAQLPKILDTKEVDLVVEAFKPNQLDLRGFLIKLINKQ